MMSVKPVSVRYSQLFGSPRQQACLEISVAAGRGFDVYAARRPLRSQRNLLLGLILAQAFKDGMNEILFRVDEQGEPTMRYGRGGESWDMVAPPADVYADLLGDVFALAVFDGPTWAAGHLRARVNGRALMVNVALERDWGLRLSWAANPT